MQDLLASLGSLETMAAGLVADAVVRGRMRAAADDEIVQFLASTARVQRLLDAVMIEAVGEVAERSEIPDRDERMTSRYGCHDVSELLQRAALISGASAARLHRASRAVHREVSITTGEPLEPILPAMRDALCGGFVGVDGVLAVAGPLLATGARVSRENLCEAEALLADAARGEGPDAAPPLPADLLRVQAQAWSIALDQDGAEPRVRMTMHKRALTLGVPTAAGVPVRGTLMPEVAAQLQRLFDSGLSPRVDGVRFAEPEEADAGDPVVPADLRTRPQKQHDLFANILSVAASSGLLPTIGGAAPTLVVTARAEDLESGSGYAHAEGSDMPLGIGAAIHAGCAGVIQRVTLGAGGRILRLGTEERVFNRHQRRAIALRDGNCLIPGCGIPAGWCEIHHVVEHADGGPTHTDNGVLLCWYHHRFLERSGWAIRMNHGVPEVRAPGWNDSSLRWRAVTTSRTRLQDAVLRR